MRVRSSLLASLLLSLSIAACGADDSNGNGSSGAGASSGAQAKPCSVSADCGDSALCATYDGASTCLPRCSASASECGGTASCEGAGSLSVNICKPPKKDAGAAGSSAAPASEPVRLPCRSDAECAAINPGAVCGSFQGVRDCTIPCTSDSPCNPPALGGVSTSFFRCGDDESTPRKVCLPRLECFNNPTSCISGLPGPGGPGGPGGAGGFNQGFGGSDPGFGGEGGF